MTFLQDNETKKRTFKFTFFRFNNKLVFKIFKFLKKVSFNFPTDSNRCYHIDYLKLDLKTTVNQSYLLNI